MNLNLDYLFLHIKNVDTISLTEYCARCSRVMNLINSARQNFDFTMWRDN